MAYLDVRKQKEQKESHEMTETEFLNSMMELGYFCESEDLTQWYNDRKGFTYNSECGESFTEIYEKAKTFMN